MMDVALLNLQRAGEIFMYTVWLQSQMSDLIVLRRHPHLVAPFIENETRVPTEMAQARAKLWTQQFASVIEELMSLYDASLVPQDRRDMKFLLMTRNSIAHAHVSLARTYMLYRPSGGERKEREIVGTLGIAPGPDAAKPFMLKLEFHVDRNYYSAFDAIKRLDEVCFERLSQSIGVPHGRMR